MPRYALSYMYCYQLGTNYAAAGVPRDQLCSELLRDGFSLRGVTMRRVLRAYDAQAALG